MPLVYHAISCDGLGGSITCTWNSQMASSLSQIRVTCSAIKMSSFQLDCANNPNENAPTHIFIETVILLHPFVITH